MIKLALLLLFSVAASLSASIDTFRPGESWPDKRGQHIQAHGGGILKLGDTYYWFGEDRGKANSPDRRYVACYASKDLLHWTFRRQIVQADDPAKLGPGWVLERPKVYHNTKTGKFVLYAHMDNSNYRYARVGIFISDTVDGDYTYLKSFRPLDQESRDIGQFIDDDGSAYLIFEARPTKGFFIAKLSDDYLSVDREVCFIKAPLEGGALVHLNNLYYIIGSRMSGWNPNPNEYATAKSLAGPWSSFKNIAPPETKTYGSQSTMMVKIVGTRRTTVIFMADIWRPDTQWDSRYLWMPLEIGEGKLWLPKPRPWSLDLQSGEVIKH